MLRLKTSVIINRTADSVKLRHGFWDLSLPADWIATEPIFVELFDRGYFAGELRGLSPKAQNVVALLDSTACFADEPRPTYSAVELCSIIERMTIAWHAAYYSHPLWNQLRAGEVRTNGFVAWALHNYHLSRSAGATAARGAMKSPDPRIRGVFLESALEEYSHCEDYYLVDDPRLGISTADCHNYIALTSSVAIDQQMHRLAESDWLGHAIVGFVQESTAAYYKKCCEFYTIVEEKYDLPHFFDPWKQHIQLDLKYGHASAFKDAIREMSGTVTHTALQRSLVGAAMTVHFLISALDEVLSEDAYSADLKLRLPVSDLAMDIESNSVLRRLRLIQEGTISEAHAPKLTSPLVPKDSLPSIDHWEVVEQMLLVSELATASLKALSHSTAHDDVVGLGKVVEYLQHNLKTDSDDNLTWNSPRVVALANHFREEASCPTAYRLSIGILSELLSFETCDNTRALANIIQEWCCRRRLGVAGATTGESRAMITGRLAELAAFPAKMSVSADPFN